MLTGKWSDGVDNEANEYYGIHMDTVNNLAATPVFGIRRVDPMVAANLVWENLNVGATIYMKDVGNTFEILFLVTNKNESPNTSGTSSDGSSYFNFLVEGTVTNGAGLALVDGATYILSSNGFVNQFSYTHSNFGMGYNFLHKQGMCVRSNSGLYHKNGFLLIFYMIDDGGVDFSKFFGAIHDLDPSSKKVLIYSYQGNDYEFTADMSFIEDGKTIYLVGTHTAGTVVELLKRVGETEFRFKIEAPTNMVSQNVGTTTPRKIVGTWDKFEKRPIKSCYTHIDTSVTNYQLDSSIYGIAQYVGLREFDSNGVDANATLSALVVGDSFQIKGLPAQSIITYQVEGLLPITISTGHDVSQGSKIYNFLVRVTGNSAVTMGVDVAFSIDNFVTQFDYDGMDGFRYTIQDGAFAANQNSLTNLNGCVLSFSMRSCEGYDFNKHFSDVEQAVKPYNFEFVYYDTVYKFRVDYAHFFEDGAVFMMWGTHPEVNRSDLLNEEASLVYKLIVDESRVVVDPDLDANEIV